ncbi:MAG TPA: hypothetical protein [Caudoviricetes sp.]|nr:MAG TPA: hypothetical protein [Caudoviricetes sp.]
MSLNKAAFGPLLLPSWLATANVRCSPSHFTALKR